MPIPRRTAALGAAALAVALAPPAVAAAPGKTFRGQTAQKRDVRLTTGSDGKVTLLRVAWRARCRTGATYSGTTTFDPPFGEADAEHVIDGGTYHGNAGKGVVGVITTKVSAKHSLDPANPAAESWAGTFRVTVVVRKRAKTIDRCKRASETWTAKLS